MSSSFHDFGDSGSALPSNARESGSKSLYTSRSVLFVACVFQLSSASDSLSGCMQTKFNNVLCEVGYIGLNATKDKTFIGSR